MTYGGIELEYDAPSGAVIAQLQSVSQDGNHVFEVPMFDPEKMPSSAGGFPWKADGDFRTVVYIKNETEEPRKFTAFLTWDGGGYATGITEIKPNQTVAVDFRELRDSQTPDQMGNTIPYNLESGQIGWSLSGTANKSLSARSEQISLSEGLASTYSCANCCPNVITDLIVHPDELEMEFGDISPFAGTEFETNLLWIPIWADLCRINGVGKHGSDSSDDRFERGIAGSRNGFCFDPRM